MTNINPQNLIDDYIIDSFLPGYVTKFEAESVKPGAITDGLNWLVKGDKVELRRGQKLIGIDAGIGKITGMGVARKIDGTDIMFKTRARKIEYYDEATSDWIENGSDVLPLAASGEDISVEPYSGMAGYAVYLSSPNSSIYKIMIYNPGDLIDFVSTDFRGKIKIRNGGLFVWDKLGGQGQVDKTGVHRSNLDKDEYSGYTLVSGENIGTGDGLEKTFNDVLAFKAAGAKRSCFGITATDGTETFTDNFDGTLTGSLGGTGTINYTNGAISVTFNSAPAGSQAITCDHYWADDTSDSLIDFSYTAVRVAGEGFQVRQDDGGGPMQNLGEYNGVYYCLHLKRTWALTVSADDATASNLPYRNKVGIPYWLAMAETGEGIYYVDCSDDNDVRIRILTLGSYSTEVIPKSISDLIDLSGYEFDKAVIKEFGDYINVACRRKNSTENDRMFVYDRNLKLWNPPTDYQANRLAIYNGALVAGDSTTNNVYELFSGWDDDDSLIDNFITFNNTNCGAEGTKKAHKFLVRGEIDKDQFYKIYASFDDEDFVEIGEIRGDGEYVNSGINVSVGASTIGKHSIGGGNDEVYAHPYEREFTYHTDLFEKVKIKFTAQGIGYCGISRFGFKDIRYKSRKVANKYLK